MTDATRNETAIIDSEVANDRHSTANTAVPAGFAGLPSAERFISNLDINSFDIFSSSDASSVLPIAAFDTVNYSNQCHRRRTHLQFLPGHDVA
jgi:hypothetical protein